tara:strand:+ start:16609 stop:16812 length:204 start_codon:yes stop_codon:yes gene_type:complete
MFAAEVEGFSVAFDREGRRFVNAHSADGVFGHFCDFPKLNNRFWRQHREIDVAAVRRLQASVTAPAG